MSRKNKLILFAFLFGVFLYVLDAIIYFIFFSDNDSFAQVLITAIPAGELQDRLLLFAGVIIFGIIASEFTKSAKNQKDISTDQTEKKIKDDNKDTSFINGLSYQIRTPLNAIVGFSELLKDPNLSMQSRQTCIRHINSSGNNLLQLVNNIVDISEIDAEKMKLKKTDFDLNKLFDDLKKYFDERKKEIGKSKVQLSLIKSRPDSWFIIISDKVRLRQIIFNLLENAFNHTDEGMVQFGYKIREGNILEVFVKDTGEEISKSWLNAILNNSSRISENQDRLFDGPSLRLTISSRLVKLMNGDFWAESKQENGSRFHFTLPYEEVKNRTDQDENKVEKPVREEKRQEKRNWSGHTILIAEDVESNYMYIRELFKPTRVELLWAKNGKVAVDLVKKNSNIKLVLMDVLMPEMDGYEAAREIKSLYPELPVIAQTAYNLEDDRSKEEISSFNDILIKPIWSSQLLTVMDKYIN